MGVHGEAWTVLVEASAYCGGAREGWLTLGGSTSSVPPVKVTEPEWMVRWWVEADAPLLRALLSK